MDNYSTVRNVISGMLVIPNLNSPSLGTHSNEYVAAENPACSRHPSWFGCLSIKCVPPAIGTPANWIKAILGISTRRVPLLKGRKAFVLMLWCLLPGLVTSPARRCASRVSVESRACLGRPSCWRLCCSFDCGRWTGCPAAWQLL